MDIRILSLIFVVLAFTVLFAWVFAPKNKERLEAQGRMPLEEEGDDR